MLARLLAGKGEDVTMEAILGLDWGDEQQRLAEERRIARGGAKPSYRHLLQRQPAKPGRPAPTP